MGTSYVEYKGFGYWSRDRYISEWIEIFLPVLSTFEEEQTWMKSTIENWRFQITIDGECISLNLDQFVSEWLTTNSSSPIDYF